MVGTRVGFARYCPGALVTNVADTKSETVGKQLIEHSIKNSAKVQLFS